MKRYLAIGYKHHRTDPDHEGMIIIEKNLFESWNDKVREVVGRLNKNPDIKKPVIITFITKL